MPNLPYEIIDKILEYVEDIEIPIKLGRYYPLVKRVSIETACSMGHLELVKYFHNAGKKCSEDVMDFAVNNGNLEVVKYLHETVGAKCTPYTVDLAVRRGHLEVVQYLDETVGVMCDILEWIRKIELGAWKQPKIPDLAKDPRFSQRSQI